MKYTPEVITELKPKEIFVFGSNESGIHGAGAARAAMKFGAHYGQGFGIAGHTFAIPTKDWKIQTLTLEKINFYVDRFVEYTEFHPTLTFLVTPIGCGLAGFHVGQIAPMFKHIWQHHAMFENIILPKSFIDYLEEMESTNFNSVLNKTTKFSPNPTRL